MNRITILSIFVILLGTAALQATDFTLINALPKRVAAARAKSKAGWDSGVTSQMRKSSSDYVNALKGIITDLGKTYYPENYLTKEALEEYVTALFAVARFKQNAGNVTGEPLGTISSLEILDSVSTDLGEMVASMVESIAADDDKFDLEQWQKRWDKAQESE
jgi:hypothetical protein